MGAVDFYTQATGLTPQRAFNDAVEQAQYENGHDGYTGTIAEKGDFVMVRLPTDYQGTAFDYAEQMIDQDQSPVRDKWGPAGCILLSSSPTHEEVATGVSTEKYKQEGTRKWETYFEVKNSSGRVLCTGPSQTDMESWAKTYAKQNAERTIVTIKKRLVNGNPETVIYHPQTKRVVSKDQKMNTYLFFGIASC